MKRTRILFLIFGVLVGVGIIAFPFVATLIDNQDQKAVAANVSTIVQDTSSEKLDKIFEQCREYNSALAGITSIYNEDGSLKTVTEDDYMELLDFGNSAMGTLEIPALDLELPIYHGTTNETISKGVGHLYGSSLPIGGTSTHTVLVSHSGLSTATLFTHLDDLEAGDIVYVHILNEIHAYTVTDKQIISPEQVETLNVIENKDILTLVTCYPVTINTHRLLVNCERDESKDKSEEYLTSDTSERRDLENDSAIWNEVNSSERDYTAERDANKAAIVITISIFIFFILSLTVFIVSTKKRGKS